MSGTYIFDRNTIVHVAEDGSQTQVFPLVKVCNLRKAADIAMKAGDDYMAENFTDSDFERPLRDADPNWQNSQKPLKRIDKIAKY